MWFGEFAYNEVATIKWTFGEYVEGIESANELGENILETFTKELAQVQFLLLTINVWQVSSWSMLNVLNTWMMNR